MPIKFEPYIENLYRFALSLCGDRHLAEDLTQDCLLRAHRQSKQLNDATKLKSWLFQILHNLWKDQLKKKQLNIDHVDQSTLISNQFSPVNLSVQKEESRKLLNSMQLLPVQQRTVLFLRAVEQMTIDEIAEATGKTKNAVKANLSIARKSMRNRTNEKLEEKTQRHPN